MTTFRKRTKISRIPRSSDKHIETIIGRVSEQTNLPRNKLKIKTDLFEQATKKLMRDFVDSNVKKKKGQKFVNVRFKV